MRTRRGSAFWPGGLGLMIEQFSPGDIVYPVAAGTMAFTGVVKDVNRGLNKVLVAWGGGSLVQHDPDEIMLHTHVLPGVAEKMRRGVKVARRMRNAHFEVKD